MCENYIIKWTRQGMARDIDQLNNFKVGKFQLSVNQYLSQDFIGVELRHQKVERSYVRIVCHLTFLLSCTFPLDDGSVQK